MCIYIFLICIYLYLYIYTLYLLIIILCKYLLFNLILYLYFVYNSLFNFCDILYRNALRSSLWTIPYFNAILPIGFFFKLTLLLEPVNFWRRRRGLKLFLLFFFLFIYVYTCSYFVILSNFFLLKVFFVWLIILVVVGSKLNGIGKVPFVNIGLNPSFEPF